MRGAATFCAPWHGAALLFRTTFVVQNALHRLGGLSFQAQVFALDRKQMARYHSSMLASLSPAPFGYKADGTPRKRRAGPGRRRDPITDAERRERVLEAKRKWWRQNRGFRRPKEDSPERLLNEGVSSGCFFRVFHPIVSANYEDWKPLRISSDEERKLAAHMLSDSSDEEVMMLLDTTRAAREELAKERKVLRICGEDLSARKILPREQPEIARWLGYGDLDRTPEVHSKRELFSELNAALLLLKSECRRRGLYAKWLTGRALQIRCTQDANPCISQQTDAAQFVDIEE